MVGFVYPEKLQILAMKSHNQEPVYALGDVKVGALLEDDGALKSDLPPQQFDNGTFN